ncbi:cell envelope integrity protein CreD [Prolixibacteraceae bacterium Z1-6]|uniref:Cell envelope integrity protein CreD n=1 Tax=Draconibacterium aestuarii TaxID=2998507 RepID=A0A9X3J5V6_9BACT|nr:cell envelope integrity protein CreD [Prolixibacteraceae bacterium Z1-6]
MEKEKQENLLDKIGISFHRKLSFKLFIIGFLVILLLIPKVMILSLINERSTNASEATHEAMSKWSDAQTVTGPVLTIPYQEKVYNEDKGKVEVFIHEATFLPKQMNITGTIKPEKLYRSIFDVIVYQSELQIDGSFDFPDFADLNIPAENVLWDQAQLLLSIGDLRGINEAVRIKWSEKELTFSPGLNHKSIGDRGISVQLPEWTNRESYAFNLKLGLKGSESILFTPVGEETTVQLTSTWNDPGFIGNFLPTDRSITQDGFEANWSVLHFNRNFPQQWTDKTSSTVNYTAFHQSDFGVQLVSMANHYQKNTRSAKYSILIILIIFIVFFMYEVFSKQRIHPFQYIMVGSALTLFYLLLLSFSEHLGFDMAYLISAAAVIVLVFLYSRTFMAKFKSSVGVALAIAACFGFVFILLQLESFALLAGSIGLFILLALLMYTTRKVNWYKE